MDLDAQSIDKSSILLPERTPMVDVSALTRPSHLQTGSVGRHMKRLPITLAAALALVTIALAGCLGDDAPSQPVNASGPGNTEAPPQEAPGGRAQSSASGSATTYTLTGVVTDDTGRPIGEATITTAPATAQAVSNRDGSFIIRDLPRGTTLVTAQAATFQNATVTVLPGDRETATAILVLSPDLASLEPSTQSLSFEGYLDCAAEHVIISGPCDATIRFTNDAIEESDGGRPLPEPVEATDAFDLRLEAGWKTAIIDVVFNPDAHPGLDGLRLSANGRDAQANVWVYERYRTVHGADPFTLRIDAGAEYETGFVAVPINATDMQLNVYPHSHGYKQVCDPGIYDGSCFLGLGAGAQVEFELLVTVFYIEPAPDGWTSLQ